MPINANDFIVGLDPTGFDTVTGAQLAQLINSGYPQVDKGLCILTTDVAGVPEVPNASTTTKWQRYLWIRQSATSVSAYVWNATGADDATYQKWVSINIAGIGAGSIVNSMIADNTIADIKIASLSFSKLTGVPSYVSLSTAAGGDLTGSTFGTPTIAALAVTTAKIAANAVTHAQLGALAVQPATDIQPSGSYQDMLRVKSGAANMEFFTPNDMVKSAAPVVAANALKIPQVNAGATDFVMVAPATVGRLVQAVGFSDSTSQNQNTTIMAADTKASLTIAGQTLYNSIGAAGSMVTPSMTLNNYVRVNVNLSTYVNATSAWFGLYDSTAGAFLAYGHFSLSGTQTNNLTFQYYGLIPATGARTYKIYFGSRSATAADVTLNKLTEGCSVIVEEIAA